MLRNPTHKMPKQLWGIPEQLLTSVRHYTKVVCRLRPPQLTQWPYCLLGLFTAFFTEKLITFVVCFLFENLIESHRVLFAANHKIIY